MPILRGVPSAFPSPRHSPRAAARAAREWLPRGRTLSPAAWQARHRGVVVLLWLHAAALPLLSLALGDTPAHALAHGAVLAAFATLAGAVPGHLARAVAATLGLLTASALAVHVSGGLTEAHFHFFVVLTVITLYEDWRTFLLAFAYVVLHHGVLGTLAADSVFSHSEATASPWVWASIHGGFVLAVGAVNVVGWRAREIAMEVRTRRERRRAEGALQHLAALVDATDDAVIGTRPDGTVTSWNPGAARLFGRSAAEMVGRSITAIVPEDLWEEERRLMAHVAEQGRLDHFETRRVRPDGTTIHVSLTLSRVRDSEGRDLGLVGVARDITERRRLEEERREHAEHLLTLTLRDELTGLGNVRAFHDALDREIARSGREGTRFTLLTFDLDEFKGVNDRYGHAEGDRVLRLMASALRGGARGSDLPCRLGGDEFALLLPGTTAVGAEVVGERVRSSLRTQCDDVDTSYGLAVWPDDGVAKDELLLHADTALYATKALRPGRDRDGLPGEADAADPLERVLALARTHLGMDVAVVGEFAGGDEVVRAVAGDAGAFGLEIDARIPLEDTYCRRMVDGRIRNVVTDAAADDAVAGLSPTTEAGVAAYVGVPLTRPGGELYGVLCCFARERRPSLGERDVKFLRLLARIAGEQLEQTRVDRFAEQLRTETTGIDALLAALAARDGYPDEHAERVSALAARVAERLGLGERLTAEVRQVARLHGVGKIGVPDAVLRKPGPLDEDELALMRRHPAVAAEILAPVPALAHLAPALRAGHEHWDGSGYPDGLRGEDIPLASRIALACTAYHAMTSDRPYRPALDAAQAARELQERAARQFDPIVVEALAAVLAGSPAGRRGA